MAALAEIAWAAAAAVEEAAEAIGGNQAVTSTAFSALKQPDASASMGGELTITSASGHGTPSKPGVKPPASNSLDYTPLAGKRKGNYPEITPKKFHVDTTENGPMGWSWQKYRTSGSTYHRRKKARYRTYRY